MPNPDPNTNVSHDWIGDVARSTLELEEKVTAKVIEKYRIDAYLDDSERERLAPELRAAIVKAFIELGQVGVTDAQVDDLLQRLLQQTKSFGKLEPLFVGQGTDEITEIQVVPDNGPPKVFAVRRGRAEPWPGVIFESNADVKAWVRKAVDDLSLPWNEANPIIDFWLPDGSRVNAIGFDLSPIQGGVVMTIRKSPRTVRSVTLEEMVKNGTMTEDMAEFITKSAVKGRLNIVFAGPTDSGKTTLMRAAAQNIQDTDHVAIVETSFELYLPHLPNCVNLVEKRRGGQVVTSIEQIVKALLRQNPDRVWVGETRQGEIIPSFDIFQSVAGGCGTSFHAMGEYELIQRVRTCFLYGGQSFSIDDAREALLATFNIAIFGRKDRNGQRRVTEIYELNPQDGFRLLFHLDRQTLEFKQDGTISQGLYDRIVFAGGEVPESMRPKN